ncbi:MAG: hypothetical protein AAGA78_12875, partial [Pseudomonadota bacterium]
PPVFPHPPTTYIYPLLNRLSLHYARTISEDRRTATQRGAALRLTVVLVPPSARNKAAGRRQTAPPGWRFSGNAR